MATDGRAGRLATAFVSQVVLSTLGTLAATALLTGLGLPGSAPRPGGATDAPIIETAPLYPALTSGGKYAARARSDDGPEPFVTLTALPDILPLFTAAAVPPLAAPPEAVPPLALQQGEPAKRAAHAAGRIALIRAASPRAPLLASVAPVPRDPKTGVIVMAALPHLDVEGGRDGSLWLQPRSAYRKAAAWSDALLDRLLP